MEGLMKMFAKSERVTTYFKGYAIQQIQCAYRIMEYLTPDSVFKPIGLNDDFYKYCEIELYEDAFDVIRDDIGIDIVSSSGTESFRAEAIELIKSLQNEYNKKKLAEKLNRRAELIKELELLDNELGFQQEVKTYDV